MEQAYCDALRFAIDMEHKGEEFYRHAAATVEDKLAKRALQFLAAEEVEHIRKIEEFNTYLLGRETFDLDKECSSQLNGRISAFIRGNMAEKAAGVTPRAKDVEVYGAALEIEKEGYDMYSSVKLPPDDERLQRFFSFLAGEEIQHYNLLAATKKYLEEPSYYFEEYGGWVFG